MESDISDPVRGVLPIPSQGWEGLGFYTFVRVGFTLACAKVHKSNTKDVSTVGMASDRQVSGGKEMVRMFTRRTFWLVRDHNSYDTKHSRIG